MSANLSSWLNEQTKGHGWSLRYVARRAGVSHSTIARLANAEVTPTPESCQAIARAFDVPVEEIMKMAGLYGEPIEARPVRESRRVVYAIDGDQVLLAKFHAMKMDDQDLVMTLIERLTECVEPRIIGEE